MCDKIAMLNDQEAIKLLSFVYSQHPSIAKASYDHDTMLVFVNEFIDLFKVHPTNSNVAEGDIAKSLLRLLIIDNNVSKIINENLNREKPTLQTFGYSADFGTFAGGR